MANLQKISVYLFFCKGKPPKILVKALNKRTIKEKTMPIKMLTVRKVFSAAYNCVLSVGTPNKLGLGGGWHKALSQ